MRETNENITRQLFKLKVFFLKYYPLRIKNVGLEERTARQLVWDFKDGNCYEEVAQMIANRLMEVFGDRVRDIVFSCVPASTTEKHELRYKGFSHRVCQLSGAMNGYEHVRVTNNRLEVHRNRKKKDVEIAENVSYDTDFFKGKQILVFDDIITRGYSYARFAKKPRSRHPESFTVGKTKCTRKDNPQKHDEMKGTKEFKATIQAYLEERTKTDELFAVSYAKADKNIDDCITYILNEVRRSGCNGFNDDEIYSMA